MNTRLLSRLPSNCFFERIGQTLTCRPMKGTAPRGATPAEDAINASTLQGSEKNRAENLMIVDLIRNDLGRLAKAGDVHVRSLFELERYATVFQLTSTVEAEPHRCRIARRNIPRAFPLRLGDRSAEGTRHADHR